MNIKPIITYFYLLSLTCLISGRRSASTVRQLTWRKDQSLITLTSPKLITKTDRWVPYIPPIWNTHQPYQIRRNKPSFPLYFCKVSLYYKIPSWIPLDDQRNFCRIGPSLQLNVISFNNLKHWWISTFNQQFTETFSQGKYKQNINKLHQI